MIRHMRHGSPPRLMALQSILSPNRRESLPTPSAGVRMIRGFHSVSLLLRKAAPTGVILTDVFGFSEIGREGSTVRFRAEGTEIGGIVHIRVAGDFLHGQQGGGSVHHIA